MAPSTGLPRLTANAGTWLCLLIAFSGALTAADGGPDTAQAVLPPAFAVVASHPGFLAVREATILTAIAKPAVPLGAATVVPVSAYRALCGTADPGFLLTEATGDEVLVHTSGERWVVARVSTLYVRASAIATVDGRQGSLFAFAPMPAPATDSKGAGILPMPDAIGIAINCGSARIFCGVRTGRLLDPNAAKAVAPGDLRAIAEQMHVPSAEQALTLINN